VKFIIFINAEEEKYILLLYSKIEPDFLVVFSITRHKTYTDWTEPVMFLSWSVSTELCHFNYTSWIL